jgi:hypothetical protein
MERARRSTRKDRFSPYALLLDGLPRPPWTQVAVQPMFLFVMVNKAHGYFVASVKGKS